MRAWDRVTGYAHKWLPYRADTSRWSGKLFAGALKHWSPHPAEAVGTTAGKVATTLQSSRVTMVGIKQNGILGWLLRGSWLTSSEYLV